MSNLENYFEALVVLAESIVQKLTNIQNDFNEIKNVLYKSGMLLPPGAKQSEQKSNLSDSRDGHVPEDIFKKIK